MARRMTIEERERFLAEPRVGIISVARDDGRPPLTTPTWFSYEPGGLITFFAGTQGRTARRSALIERAGVVTFSVHTDDYPYRYVTIEGTVVGEERPPSEQQLLAIVGRYLPEDLAREFVAGELANPGPGFVLYSVRPERWLTSDFSDEPVTSDSLEPDHPSGAETHRDSA